MRIAFATSTQYFEVLNAIWAILELYFTAWMLYYVVRALARDEAGKRWRASTAAYRLFDYRRPRLLATAAAILVFHLGDLLRAGTVWWWRHQVNRHGADVQDIWPTVVPAVTAGVVLACVGLFLMILMFADRNFWKVWLVVTGIVLTVAVLNYVIF